MSASALPGAMRTALRAVLVVGLAVLALALSAPHASAAPSATAAAAALPGTQVAPVAPAPGPIMTDPPAAGLVPGSPLEVPIGEGGEGGQLKVDLGGVGNKGTSQAVLAILGLTVLSLAPALLLLTTSFTRIVIVLSLTRNALGVQAIPPNQVIVGLAMFLSLFIMGPTLEKMNDTALQPLLRDEISLQTAYDEGVKPMREFMFKEVKEQELLLFTGVTMDEKPSRPEDVPMKALVPAFVLSEIKTAFIIGFVIFIPFLVIDIVVASSLMSMGMMMLPPVLISLPFKLLLFVMVDGWALIVQSLLTSYQ
jgi:flagellar biosynthetic protein FliP